MAQNTQNILQDNIESVYKRIKTAAENVGRNPSEITLVAATKVQSSDTIKAAIKYGIKCCGENRVQEFTAHLNDNAYEGSDVHFIGHLQKNKVKYLVGKVSLIESVDSDGLITAINDRAVKVGVIQDILIEINIGGELSKSGIEPSELSNLLALANTMSNIRVKGLMCIPPIAVDDNENLQYFKKMYAIFIDTKEKISDNKEYDQNKISMDILSMGMSGDFENAIKCGATQVRVGTALFGQRIYS